MIDAERTIQQKQGFSSQQELNQQTLQLQNENSNIDEPEVQKLRKNALNNIQPAQQIIKKQYSLEPDMLTGWKPKIYLSKPIPLIFCNDELDYSIDTLIKMKTYPKQTSLENKSFIQLVYLGPRYQSTYSAWYEKPFDFPYTHLNKNKRLKFTDRQFVGQYWHAETQNHLHFDSFFESGNLDVAFKIGEFQYDLFIRVDSNTKGHLQWYNFKVKNMKKGEKYKFNICNFLKGKSLYSRGMKPFVYSKKRFQKENIGWEQSGDLVSYQRKAPRSFKMSKIDIQNKPYRLSFQYQNEYEHDQLQFAYCVPYQYSKLKLFIQKLQQKCKGKNFLKISKLCYSLGGLEIPLLTITSNISEKSPTEKQNSKKLIFASGRIHPGQSNGSFMIQGFIQFLCSNSEQSQKLRDSIVFKIVPMINPDGVVIGNYRTSLSGKDLNRQFINPDQYIFPQIYNLKKIIWKEREIYKQDFLMYLDFHGHSTKKNCFTYGPQFPITNSNYYECRIFPRLVSSKTEMFRYFSCIFKISQCKQKTLRAVLLKVFGLNLVYTIQVSNGCYYNHQSLEDIYFDERKWLQMGQYIGQSIFQYNQILLEIQKIRMKKKQQKLRIKKIKDKSKLKSGLLKKQQRTLSRDKQRIVFSLQKSQSSTKKMNKTFMQISPSKKKKTEFSLPSFDQTRNKNQEEQKIEEQLIFDIPQLQDQSLNSILNLIYRKEKKPNINSQIEQPLQNQNSLKIQNGSERSDDNISQGGSDSSASDQDFNQQFKQKLFKNIKKGAQKINVYKIRSNYKKHKKEQNCTDNNNQSDQQQYLNKRQSFLTEADDETTQFQDANLSSKISSMKMNQLRSKKRIYLKKKNNKFNISPSPKKQEPSLTAKIVNFQFSLNPIKQISHVWNQFETKGTNYKTRYHTQKSQQKFDIKYNPTLTQYMTQTSSLEVKRQSRLSQYSQNFRKTFLSVQKEFQNQNNHSVNVRNNWALRKTQEKKPIINSTFYKSLKSSKTLEDNNIICKRISNQ